jgi:hypothetical protein
VKEMTPRTINPMVIIKRATGLSRDPLMRFIDYSWFVIVIRVRRAAGAQHEKRARLTIQHAHLESGLQALLARHYDPLPFL